MVTMPEKNLLLKSSGNLEDRGNQHHVPDDRNLDNAKRTSNQTQLLFIHTSVLCI
jgi:hypothetical protein